MSRASTAAITAPPEPLSKDVAGVHFADAARVARFVLLQQLGSGGMGTVFAAYDPDLDRKVALKILHQHQTPDASSRKQAMQEARALARVVHPRVVSVYDVGEAGERTYLAREFVEGQTLRGWQTQSPRGWRAILHMYLQAGEGLHAVHRAGVIHRDFKPDNVLVQARDGLPKVVDFGIARVPDRVPDRTADRIGDLQSQSGTGLAAPAEGPAAAYEPLTQGSQVPGTQGYMSPEQQDGDPITAASDQYSFCVSLWEALFAQLPTLDAASEGTGATAGPSTATSAARQSPAPLRATIDVSPSELQTILKRGMARDPQQRFDSMRTLLAELWRQHDAHVSAGPSRHFVTVAIPMLALLGWLAFQYGLIQRIRLVSLGVGVSALSLTVTLTVGFVYRRGLRQNLPHRFMWMLLLVHYLQNLGMRLASAFIPPGGYRRGIVIEMILVSGTLAFVSTLLIRSARWLLLLPALATALCLWTESPPFQVLGLINSLLIVTLLWQWRALSLSNSPPEAQLGRLLWLDVPTTRRGAACVHCGQSPVRSAAPSD